MSTIVAATLSNGTVSTSTANVIRGSARAWVNFNGTGTVAIRASYNVSSITDNGTGDYTVNFTNALPDANYCITGSATLSTSGPSAPRTMAPYDVSTQTTTSSRIRTGDDTGTVGDMALVCVAVFD